MKGVTTPHLLLIATLAYTANVAIASENLGFKTFNDITAALNPLEQIANHGGIRRSIDLNIQFAVNSNKILPAADRQVQALGKALMSTKLKGCDISLIGHTDITGTAEANMKLSLARALAVKQALVEQFGMADSRIITQGKGATELIKKLAKDSAKHRRVEIGLVDIEKCRHSVSQKGKENTVGKDGNIKIKW